ncbi:MAG: diguanylate cyclase [Magnetococcales bacterium]|nr:diguanylate cyclase [Magnetococcales bacterium]NGZ26330.1 diguanylate cyclase [Magnetococcales bacterium]
MTQDSSLNRPYSAHTDVKLRIGIVGAGRGGWSLLQVLMDLPKVQVVGICDLDPKAPGLSKAKTLHVPIFTNVSDMIANQEMDWLINVTHSSLTQRHMLTREVTKPIHILDGAAAEVVWRFLTGFHQQVQQCSQSERTCAYNMVWTLINRIANAVGEMQQRLTDIAFHDPLTGLFTRRILMEFLEHEIRNTYRLSHPLSLIIMDIDHFKSINDEFGHLEGDRILQELAGLLKENHRPSDLVARIGGEEFVIVLPETDQENGMRIAERLRGQVEKSLQRPDGTPLTVSLGVAELNINDPIPQRMTPSALIECADQALYHAKNSGRNRVLPFNPDWKRIAF